MIVKVDTADYVQLAQLACALLGYEFLGAYGRKISYVDGGVSKQAELVDFNGLLKLAIKHGIDKLMERNKAGQYLLNFPAERSADGVGLFLVDRSLAAIYTRALACLKYGSEVNISPSPITTQTGSGQLILPPIVSPLVIGLTV